MKKLPVQRTDTITRKNIANALKKLTKDGTQEMQGNSEDQRLAIAREIIGDRVGRTSIAVARHTNRIFEIGW